MSTMTYKGFEIEAAPSRLRSGEWTVKRFTFRLNEMGTHCRELVMRWTHFQLEEDDLAP